MTNIFKLVVKSGDDINKTYLLDKHKNTIGRDPKSDFVVDDIEISRNHLEVLVKGESVLLKDLNSTNGTFLNGKRLEKTATVTDGDLISIGKNVVLEFIQEKAYEEPQPIPIDEIEPSPIPVNVKEQPAKQTPIEHAPVEHAPIEQAPIERAPIEQAPIEQAPIERRSLENDILEQKTGSSEDEPQKTRSSKPHKMPTWVLILIIALGFLVIFCLVPLLVIEVTDQWCNLFAGFFNSMSPGVCL